MYKQYSDDKHSLSVLLSFMETSCTTQTALALARLPLAEIIHMRVHVAQKVVAATIQGRHLLHSEFLTVQLLFIDIV